MAEILQYWWSIILAFVSVVVWGVRLEMKVKQNQDQLNLQRTEVKAVEARILSQRSEDIAAQQRANDRLEDKLDSIQGDIKEILILLLGYFSMY